jgi:hypothetical protein
MKDYSMRFGTSSDPRTLTGLSPTFLIFARLSDGATIAPPAINEPLPGSGIYHFQYGTTQAITFLADSATISTGTGRYVSGQLDPSDRSDEYGNSLIALGTSILSLSSSGSSFIGTVGSTFGSSTTDPVDLFGYLKRIQENLEGNNTYIKPTGAFSIYSRGSSTLLAAKVVVNSVSMVVKS